MTNKIVLNEDNLYGNLYMRRFNFVNKFKTQNKLFLDNIKDIENIESKGCKLTEGSVWVIDNFLFIQNQSSSLFESEYFKTHKYNSIELDNRYFPRVYLFCLNFFENLNGLIKEVDFFSKLSLYEDKVKLSLNELWSIPVFLKYVILEKIYGAVDEIRKIEDEYYEGYMRFNHVIKLINDGKFKVAFNKLSALLKNKVSFYTIESFIDLVYENRVKDNIIDKFIVKLLNNEGLTYEKLKQINSVNLKDIRITISTYIQSLKNLSLFNWKTQLESVSSVHKEFLKDPSGVYPKMDYESRDYYRKTLEKICRVNRLDEYKEAVNIVNLSLKGSCSYEKHVGYYLIDEGSYRFKNIKRKNRNVKRLYFISNFSAIVLSEIGIFYGLRSVFDNVYLTLVLSIFILIVVSDIIINFINYMFLENVDNRFVPKMDYCDNIPDNLKTMVVIPSLLTNKQDIDDLVKNLELAYICNRSENIYFSLLLDYTDTISYEKFGDKNLLDYANESIDNLNRKYQCNNKKFYLFIRDKVYSEGNKIYMGWERKRGKIMEFIKFIKGRESNYKYSIEDYKEIRDIRYIITIDSDTKLVKNSAFKLIGAIDHTLNRAIIKNINKRNVVVRGYGIIQPRVSISFKSSLNTVYSKLFCGNTETSSYNSVVSNIYQDVFSESIFIGKGIIDIDVFDKVLWNVIPENRILSHDLIEGCFTRVSLSSDIELQESFPSNILSNFNRLHRWTRGDLQLIPYLIKGRGINLLSKYKILDNIRRSLLPISYLAMFVMIFFIPSSKRMLYYGIFTLSLIFPFILEISSLNLVNVSKDRFLFKVNSLKDRLTQSFVMFSFIPYYAYITLDAMVKVFIRLIFTKQNLLEWKSFNEVEKSVQDSILNYLREMFPCLILGFLGLFFGGYFKVYGMILPSFIFVISPFIAYKLSNKYRVKRQSINGTHNIFLRSLSRSIFAYFEDFVGESTNYLVCDNYQEDPAIGIAKKTSPTNIGMSLTSFILGRDFGFTTIQDMIDRLDKILDSIDILPTYRGHLYNWYDIENNIPLGNKYVSTVDSGNLLASYYLCRKSLQDILNKPIIHKDLVKGFEELSYLSSNFSKDHLYREVIDKGFKCVDFNGYISFLKDIIEESRNNISELSKNGEDVYWHIKINESSNNFLNEINNLTCSIYEINNFKTNKFGELFINVNIIDLEKKIFEYKTNYNNSSVRNEQVDLKISNILSNVSKLTNRINLLIDRISFKIDNMDFKFLYNNRKGLLSIGYDCENDILDENCYDLLASEVRIASFLSIAKGDVPVEHWFKLNRLGIKENNIKTLLSWSGTMFEYLMPMLYMKAYPGTLLFDTYKGCVYSQVKYGNLNKIPFGISESCFYELDNELNYQYRAFGVPNLSIKKDYENLVVSPYSSIMSLTVDFKNSIKNLNYLDKLGVLGKYGFYEAVDFTKSRISRENEYSIVKNYMAHHQGMSLMSLGNLLIDNVCQDRFSDIVDVESVDELLNESNLNISIKKLNEDNFVKDKSTLLEDEFIPRVVRYQKDKICDMQIYSNGDYSLCLSASGGGYLKFKDDYISKLSEDFTNENTWGNLYIKDLDTQEIFSNTYLPCKNDSIDYICEFSFNKAKFMCKNKNLNVTSEIIVSKDENVEIRKIIFRNLTSKVRDIEITSYFESDAVKSTLDYINDENICICGNEINDLFIAHSIYFGNNIINNVEFEGVKEGFIGRNGTLQYPIAMGSRSLYGKYISSSNDNIMSLRSTLKLSPYGYTSIYFINSIGSNKEEVCSIIEKYRNIDTINSLFQNNIYNLKSMINNLNISATELSLFNYMTSSIIYGYSNNRNVINEQMNIKDLIAHNIDCNIPIVSIEINSTNDLDNLRTLVKAYAYFLVNNLQFNLIILNSYIRYDKYIENEIDKIILDYNLKEKINVDNGIYVILSNLYKTACEIIKSISNLHILSGGKSIYDQIGFVTKDLQEVLKEDRRNNLILNDNLDEPSFSSRIFMNKYLFEVSDEISNYDSITKYDMPKKMLKYYNSYGGFDIKDSEYVLRVNESNITPNYYRNILSNKYISTMVSSKGFVTTWAFGCKEFSITDDLDRDNYNYKGECIYIKEGDKLWSPTFNPMSNGKDYIVYSSSNYSKVKNKYDNIQTNVKYFIPKDKKYKVIKINFKNLSLHKRELKVCYFSPLVLGSKRDYCKKLLTSIDFNFNYIYAENNFSKDFSNIKAYLKMFGCDDVSFTGSKREFLGINRGYFNPIGMYKDKLSNLSGIFSESCLCTMGNLILEKNEERDVYLVLGYDDNIDSINNELTRFTKNNNLFNELEEELYSRLNSEYRTFKLKTCDDYTDILINSWLLYQNHNEKYLLNSSYKGELDSCVGLIEKCLVYTYLNPDESKKNIIKVFSNMYKDGTFKDKWSYLTREFDINDNVYDLLDIVYCTIDYLNVTGDFDLLNIDVKFANDSENNDINIGFSTIYDKCVKIINKYLDLTCDIKKNFKDTSTLLILYKVIDGFLDIARKMNDINIKNLIENSKIEIIDFIKRECFNGEFYVNKLNDIGTQQFYNDIYLLPQILSLSVVPDTSNKVLFAIDKYLVNKEVGFIREYFRKDINLLKEFESIQNNRITLLFIRELLNLGFNDKAYSYLRFLNPILKTYTRNYVNSYKSEPYIIPYKLIYKGNNLSKVVNEDFKYVSSLFYRIFIENVLGIKMVENGFYIEPCIPSTWDNYILECSFNNVNFKIIVRRGNLNNLKINGEKYEEKIINFMDKTINVIDLTF